MPLLPGFTTSKNRHNTISCSVTSKAVARRGQGYNLDFAQHTHTDSQHIQHTHAHAIHGCFEQPIKFCVAANLKSFKNLVFGISKNTDYF